MHPLHSKHVFAAFAGRYARELSDRQVDEDDEEIVLPRQLFEMVRCDALPQQTKSNQHALLTHFSFPFTHFLFHSHIIIFTHPMIDHTISDA